ncbi:MAG: peptidoglycan editing factor PgeF [Alphaproteobacteria bacterium]|nr:peptidoglycan editing factor PgeF [Alphaproteobacteria bacterium]
MTDTTPTILTAEPLSALDGVRHGFFTRRGGVSTGIYESLNVGYGSDDAAADVRENRRRAMAAFDPSAPPLNTVHQVHGRTVARVERPWDPADSPQADALVSAVPGIALGILAADCAPVLFADAGGPVVGAAHAGWRGAIGGVVEATVAAMEELGARRSHIHAVVGPTIGPQSYEIGPEFPAPFLAEDQENALFFVPSTRDGHQMFDLPGYLAKKLRALNLASATVLPRDTCAEPDAFFSYRRGTLIGESDYGRGLSAIMAGD